MKIFMFNKYSVGIQVSSSLISQVSGKKREALNMDF